MDRQLLERLIGAGVLVVALVVIVPAILDGESDDEDEAGLESAVTATTNEPRRTHTIRLDRSAQSPPVAREVAQPAAKSDGQGDIGTVSSREPAKPASTPAAKPVTQAATAPPAARPVTKTKTPPKPSPAPKPAETAPVPGAGWAVQLGSFSSRENAQQLADEVGGRGFPVFRMTLDRSGKKLYRVRVGPRESRAQATELAERLKKAGYSGQVTQ